MQTLNQKPPDPVESVRKGDLLLGPALHLTVWGRKDAPVEPDSSVHAAVKEPPFNRAQCQAVCKADGQNGPLQVSLGCSSHQPSAEKQGMKYDGSGRPTSRRPPSAYPQA